MTPPEDPTPPEPAQPDPSATAAIDQAMAALRPLRDAAVDTRAKLREAGFSAEASERMAEQLYLSMLKKAMGFR